MGAAVIAAAMRRREQEVIDDFRAAGATSPDRAQSYTAIGPGESLAVRRLRNRAVIREASPGFFYLDEEVWAAVRRTRQRMLTVFIALLTVLLVGVLLGIIKL
ncbi:MAG TPA: hypothetical protein VJV97_04495 [Gemmatimonadaceae bacterium]|nr:hypothetical protein [Gemmatimonadaceae bacterium]